jgi:hypothetical protein
MIVLLEAKATSLWSRKQCPGSSPGGRGLQHRWRIVLWSGREARANARAHSTPGDTGYEVTHLSFDRDPAPRIP